MKRYLIITSIAIIIVLLFFCNKKNNAVHVDITKDAAEKLSDYGFFIGDIKNLNPNTGVIPYDLNSALFSDYAYKSRFVWMPDGSAANYSSDEVFDFPDGAVLIKTFYYQLDFRQPDGDRRILETRLLVKKTNGWQALDYIWNDEQTEAYLEQAGDTKNVSWIDENGKKQSTQYMIPNKNQCKNCHNLNDQLMPIGPKARNLNKDYTYADGKANQLDKWTSVGYLKGCGTPNTIAKNAQWDIPSSGTIEDRAKAYLEINCAHCHRQEGSANTSGLYLLLSEKNPESWGIMKSPVAAGKASGDCLYDIVPGKPDESIFIFRMNSTDPGIMMPELGRSMIHHEGVALIRQWIAEMK